MTLAPTTFCILTVHTQLEELPLVFSIEQSISTVTPSLVTPQVQSGPITTTTEIGGITLAMKQSVGLVIALLLEILTKLVLANYFDEDHDIWRLSSLSRGPR